MSVKKMFQSDNLFNNVMTKIFDLMLLSVLWLLCSIPVITIGASTAALYDTTMKMAEGRAEGIWKGFFRAFRGNFRQSIPITLAFLLLIGILTADFHILSSSKRNEASLLYGGCITILVIGCAVFSYAFPLLAKFENTFQNTMINAAKIAVTHLVQTAVILIVNFLPIVWFLVSPETFSLVFWLWIIVGTGIAAYVNSILLVKVFGEFIPQEEDIKENEQ